MTAEEPTHPLDRRAFLGAVVGAFLTACTDGERATSSAPSSTETTSSSGTAPTTTAQTTTPSTTEPSVVGRAAPPVALPVDAFALGIASGEPDHESVVLWTRLLGDLPPSFDIVCDVATDSAFTQLVSSELASVDADAAHSVRFIAGGLEPNQQFFYRFRAGELISPVGQTRTLPTRAAQQPITLGISSCQARSDGAWAAHRDLAETDVDLVLWLGDYIYGDHRTLDEQRAAYVEYRSDPVLQACHAAHPWVALIDDHEVANDFDASIDPDRRGAALRAWWEHQPTRLAAPDASGALTVHRSFDLGGVARLIGLDVRQYADGTTLLGAAQWAFIEEAVQHRAVHTLIASPVIMSGLRDLGGEPLVGYSIDARPDERRRMADLLATTSNPLIVSGDLHTSLVADFSADPLDGTAPNVAVEIMAPAISSAFPDRFRALAPLLPLVNPQLRDVTVDNGWLELTLAPSERRAVFHYVDDVADPASTITLAPVPGL